MAKTYIIADIAIKLMSLSPAAQGGYVLNVEYRLIDSAGNEVPIPVWHSELLDGTQTFSAVLGLTSQTLTGKANQQVKVARDVVRDHVGDLLEWVKTRIRVKEGL